MAVKYPLKGVFKVTAKGRTYWYACADRLSARGSPVRRGRRSFTPAMSRLMRHCARLTPDGSTLWLWPTRRAPTTRSSRHPPRKPGHPGSIVSQSTSAICALRSSSGRRRSGQSSSAGGTAGQTSRAPPTTHSRFFPVFCRMRSTRSGSSPATPARALSVSTTPIGRRSSGP